MPQRTFYPTFRRTVHRFAVFVARHRAQMVQRAGITDTTELAQLDALLSALQVIDTEWPPYEYAP